MKKFIGYLKAYYDEEFSWSYLAFIVLFLTGAIYWVYHDPYEFISQRNLLITTPGKRFLYPLFYAIPFLVAFGGHSIFKRNFSFFAKWQFWALFVVAVLIFSFRQMFYLDFYEWTERFSFEKYPYFFRKVLTDAVQLIFVLTAITLVWLFDRKSSDSPYGFTLKNFDLKPYFIILAIMLPFVIGFGLTDHFTGYYPRGLKNHSYYFNGELNVSGWYYVLYELIYGLDFISIEYFFRGFLVIAFIRFVGPGSIMPMATFYVFIHFGKPMVETISSFFGGTLLGIITYYSRSIWGGIVVHMGIAWLMELGAFIGQSNK
jgi:hypothetical protein